MTDPIRPIALALCRDDGGRILVERGYDSVRDEHYLRGIGGGIEFGERAVEALHREWMEELGLTLRDPRLLGVLENMFKHEGRSGHEIVFVYAAAIVEPWVYERHEFEHTEATGLAHRAVWLTPSDLRASAMACYPPGLVDLCAQLGETARSSAS